MNEFTYSNMCFGCGTENPFGLKLQFEEVDNKYVTTFTPSEFHQGYPGIMHGGIMGTILDELMGRFLWIHGTMAYTVSLEIKFHAPVQIGDSIRAEAQLVKQSGRIYDMRSAAYNSDGILVAEARGRFVKPKAGEGSNNG